MTTYTRATQIVRDAHNSAKVHVFNRTESGEIGYRQFIEYIPSPEALERAGLSPFWKLWGLDVNIDSGHGYAHYCELQGKRLNTLTSMKSQLAAMVRRDRKDSYSLSCGKGVVRSRGVELRTVLPDSSGEFSDCVPVGRLTNLLINEACGETGRICLEIGHDWAGSPLDFQAGDYEPDYTYGASLSLIPSNAPHGVYFG